MWSEYPHLAFFIRSQQHDTCTMYTTWEYTGQPCSDQMPCTPQMLAAGLLDAKVLLTESAVDKHLYGDVSVSK